MQPEAIDGTIAASFVVREGMGTEQAGAGAGKLGTWCLEVSKFPVFFMSYLLTVGLWKMDMSIRYLRKVEKV